MRNWLGQPSTRFHHLLFDGVSPSRQWRVSLGLAVGTHLLVLVIALLSPYLFHASRKMPEIYTVNLFNVQELSVPQPAAPAAPAAAPVEEEKAVEKVPEPAPPPPAPPSAPPKAISTQPLPAKTKTDLERLKRLKELLATQQKAKEAEKTAQDKTKEAVEALKRALAAQKSAEKGTAVTTPQAAASQPKGNAGAGAAGPSGGVVVDEIFRRYLIAVNSQIQEHWQLPDLQSWKDDLEAVMVIRVRRDGVVLENFFEQRSANLYFNQFVEKAIKDAAPLPPFPLGLDLKEIEIGLRFRPGRVY